MTTNMAADITDEEIKKYYRPGAIFNVGTGPFDRMAEVEKVEIIF